MKRKPFIIASIVIFAVSVSFSIAQQGFRNNRGFNFQTPNRNGVPEWAVDPEFKDDVFTFVRVRYSSYRRGNAWRTDYPDSDLNFSYRLQQLTSMKVDPDGLILDLTDPELFNYPFLYMIEPGGLSFNEDEVTALRKYLLNGGFLMVDDFWGENEWHNFYYEIKRVFPNREPIELPPEHPIFHAVYDLKEKPQIPSIGAAQWGRTQGITWERDDAREVHYKGIFDDKGRMMAIICHNTDLGDGWEREGEDPWYFREFSEKKAYPLGINIVFYAMTH
ncbi:MAG: transmembrane prediction [Planctomycetaceae bacterium]|nr:transmembrane prediction [Planctomycetaceae bacterium]